MQSRALARAALCPFIRLLCSPTTLVSDARLYLPRKRTKKRYPDEPESYQRAIHHPTRLVLPAVLRSVTLITVIHKICGAVYFCLVLHSQQGCEDASHPGRRARLHVHAVPSGAVVCGVRAHFGGALSRYQVVFPSAPERALIVLLFNLLVILDAGQEPFSQT